MAMPQAAKVMQNCLLIFAMALDLDGKELHRH
jgi:hypothetical protein